MPAKFKRVVAYITLLFMMVIFSAPASASVTITVPNTEREAVQTLFRALELNDMFLLHPQGAEGSVVPLLTFADRTITFNKDAFRQASNITRRNSVSALVNELRASTVSDQTQQNMFEQLSSFDKDISALLVPLVFDGVNADLFTAFRWVYPFLQVVRLAFGIGAIMIVLLLIASTILDLAYIGLPFAREYGGKDGKPSFKPPGVSYDALKTVRDTESSLDSSGGYKNAYITYFSRRAMTYVILSVCLLYLVAGELGGLIAWIMGLASGIVG